MADEDDQWLYGDGEGAAEQQEERKEQDVAPEDVSDKNAEPLLPPVIAPEVSEKEATPDKEDDDGELDGDDDDDDDDDSDDNVNVVIGDISKSTPTYTNINIKRGGPTGLGIKQTGKFSVDEFDQVGAINGIPVQEYNIDTLEEKPWRKPGADITDYFNYGFTEDTWKAYIERQKRIRIHESGAGLPPPNSQNFQQPAPTANPQSNTPKKSPYDSGQIRVIGASVASRRTDEGAGESATPGNFSMPPPSMSMPPPMGVPPPGFPPPHNHYGGPPGGGDYYDDYFGGYEPTAADQWNNGWAPSNLVTPGQTIKTLSGVNDDSLESIESSRRSRRSQSRIDDERRGRDRDRRRSRSRSRDRDRDRDRDRERKRKSRSRSPSHKKHKKKSKKSDKKRSRSRTRSRSKD